MKLIRFFSYQLPVYVDPAAVLMLLVADSMPGTVGESEQKTLIYLKNLEGTVRPYIAVSHPIEEVASAINEARTRTQSVVVQ